MGGGHDRSPRVTRRSMIGGMTAGAIAPAVLRAATPGSAAHVAVIGAGVFGAWTAEHLRRAGNRVTLIDMAGPANSRASSGGDSRMTRGAYGQDEIYTRMALASLSEWRSLSQRSGLPIFIQSGVLFFSASDNDYFRASVEVHRRLKLPLERLEGPSLQARFPMIEFGPGSIGLFEPEFGALMARRAVQTLVKQFVDKGGDYRLDLARPPRGSAGRLGEVELSGGALSADAFIFALGPWLPRLFPEILGRRIFATRQEIFYFTPPAGDRRFLPGAMPGWADFNQGDIYYGFPDLEGRGVKFAHDQHGAYVDPDTQPRSPTRAALEEVIAFRDQRFPLLRGAPLSGAEVCQYENSSNGDFLIDRHPDMENVILVGGGSGHGFKHGPEVGRLAARLVLGQDGQSERRVSLATKGETQLREVH
ncbi:MAG: FAD-dependent oxidoreductase [Sphingomonas sp.]|nr:FAD-dependent oxidoreductase [Sphingomonas sp.]